MSEGIWLRKGKIYKVRTNSRFKRDYMLFSPLNSFYFSGIFTNYLETLFTINLNGDFKTSSSLGLWPDDTIEPLTVNNWLEVGQYLKNTNFRINLRTKELVEIKVKEEELVEL